MSSIASYAFDITDYDSGNGTTIYDNSGNGNNLIKTNSSGGEWDSDDPFDDSNIYSFHFDKSEHFERNMTDSYTGNFSLGFWFRPNNSTMVKNEGIVAFSDNNNQNTFQIGTPYNGNEIQVQCHKVPRLFSIAEYTGYGVGGAWNHVAVTFDNGSATLKVYFNGSLTNIYNRNSSVPTTNTEDASEDLQFNIDRIKIGTNRQETNKFGGWLTLLNLYDHVLDETGITSLYNNNQVCYHENTKILTLDGYRYINSIKRGDYIYTLNHTYQPVSKVIKTINIRKEFIKFSKNSIGNNIPNEDLYITEGHPIYFIGEYYLSENFINNNDILIVKNNSPFLYHLQFDDHYVINTNNMLTTSLPHNTNYFNHYLKEDEFFDKTKFNKNNIGKHYKPHMLHTDPLILRDIKLLSIPKLFDQIILINYDNLKKNFIKLGFIVNNFNEKSIYKKSLFIIKDLRKKIITFDNCIYLLYNCDLDVKNKINIENIEKTMNINFCKKILQLIEKTVIH